MSARPDVSLIVPCYNAERYLEVCLSSIAAQKRPELQIILIDDGSTDATGAILDRFAKRDGRAQVCHVKNAGVSAARNRGLSLATRRRIAFADADDALEENALETLWEAAERSGADIVSANHTYFDMRTENRRPLEGFTPAATPAQAVRAIIRMSRVYNNLWNKLYDARLFSGGLRLDEGVRIGEDALLNLQLYHRARRVTHLAERTYVYRVHDASAMASISGYSEAHQPMLRSMSRILTQEGIKELYFRDFLMSAVWIDEKEKGIRACMRTFNRRVRPVVLEGLDEERISVTDRRLYRIVCRGWFPVWYTAQRVNEKLHGRKGSRRG